MPFDRGARLGPYEILGTLGAGGMGEVYRARDTRLDRTVAIKVLPSAVAGNRDALARFEREARAVAALDHPHICGIYDVGSVDGTHYLVMPALDGETLAARLEKGSLPLDHTLTIAAEIADALDKAHRQGIIHRDLKPANIMVTRTGAKLLDFGLAKLRTRTDSILMSGITQIPTQAPETAHGMILGTVPYMSPEQVEGKDADARSDIWALGAVIYEMATGKRAFQGTSAASIIGAILRDQPPPVSTLRPVSPPVVDHIVSVCLEKDPDHRWQSAADIVHELKWKPAIDVAQAPTRRARAWLPWAVAGLATLAAATASILLSRNPTPTVPVARLEVATPPSINPHWITLTEDGQQLAFLASEGGVSRLWVRRLDQAVARPLAGTDGAFHPFWSHDGRSLGFFADGKLKRIDLPDGAPRVIADAPIGRGGTWNADDVIVFAPAAVGPLMRISASGGTPEPVTRVTIDRGSHRYPRFLPDGRRFTFLVAQSPPDVRGTYIGSLDGGDTRRVLPNENVAYYADPGVLLSVYESTLVAMPFDLEAGNITGEPITLAEDIGVPGGSWHGAFSPSQAGVIVHRAMPSATRQLTWFDRSGTERGTVGPRDSDNLTSPSLSPDGHRVSVSRRVKANSDTWTIDVARGVVTRATAEPGIDGSSIWSPDGRLLISSDRHGVFEVLRLSPAGTAERIVSLKESSVPQSFSSDGQMLVFTLQNSTTAADIWAKPMTDGGEMFPVVQTPADDLSAQLSPDGRWLAFESTVSGRSEVYVQAFPTSAERWQVSRAGGVQPRWRRDGRELFYVASDAHLMAVSITPTSSNLNPGMAVPLFGTRLATPTAAATFQKPQYDVSPDGRFIMNLELEAAPTAPIQVILNWPQLLKRQPYAVMR